MNRRRDLILLLALIVTAAAWLLWRRGNADVIDTPHGRVKLETDSRKRSYWHGYYDGLTEATSPKKLARKRRQHRERWGNDDG